MEASQDYVFLKKRHVAFLRRSLAILPATTVTYDTSRMTVLYFALSGLDIIGALDEVPRQEIQEITEWIHSLQLTTADGHACGGFRGGHCFTGVNAPSESSTKSASQAVQSNNHSISNHTRLNSLQNSNKIIKLDSSSASANDISDSNLANCDLPEKIQKLLDTDIKQGRSLQGSSSNNKKNENGGGNSLTVSGAGFGHLTFDSGHLTMSYTALAALAILGDDMSKLDKAAILQHVASLQCSDGSFQSNSGGSENDLRFVYCAAAVCHMLGDMGAIDCAGAARYTMACLGYGGALGQGALQESHGGSTYCGVAALHLLGYLPGGARGGSDAMSEAQVQALVRWLVMRQEHVRLTDETGKAQLGGGLQGRPNKPGDTCYTFWIGATLKLLGCGELLSPGPLLQFVLATQDPVRGGLSKNTSAGPDGLHTYLGLSGLAVLGLQPGLNEVDPALNITRRAKLHLESLEIHLR